LQTSEGAESCGDLSYKASDEEKAKAVMCVRDALAAAKPFEVFWETLGTDSINPGGLVARLENGELRVFALTVYNPNTLGLDLVGATATWSPGSLSISPFCATTPDECFVFAATDRSHCDCLPQGKRPAAADGAMVELRCQAR
jgi:hypothetical protein